MSQPRPGRKTAKRPAQSVLFAALGHEARLALMNRLSPGEPLSISELAHGSRLTRQAITKHLRVLAKAGIARCKRAGRETLFTLNPEPIGEMQSYLELVSRQWDQALLRLKQFVED